MAPLPPQARMLASAFRKAQGARKTPPAEAPSAMLYLGMGCIALLKDLLDFAGVGSFPGIGTIVTACFGFLIWMLMTLFDRSGGKSQNKIARSLVLLFASLVEAIGFGLNFLPIETLTVMALYIMAQSAFKAEQLRLQREEEESNRMEQMRTYRLQAQVAEQARVTQEAANDPEYQKQKKVA